MNPLTDTITLIYGLLVMVVVLATVAECKRRVDAGMPSPWWVRITGRYPVLVGATIGPAINGLMFSIPAPIARVLLGTPLLLCVGLLFFWVKVSRGLWWASAEIVLAVVTAGYSMWSVGEEVSVPAGLGLLSGAFLMQRGLEDLRDAKKAANERQSAGG